MQVKVLARDWKMEIEDSATAGTFVEIAGIESFTFGSSKTDADTKTFDTDGWDEHIVAGRGRTLGFEGKYLEDPDTKERDAGQQLVEDAAELIGHDSLVNFKLTSPVGVVRSFKASVNLKDIGGGVNDSTSFGADLTVSGKVTKESIEEPTEEPTEE